MSNPISVRRVYIKPVDADGNSTRELSVGIAASINEAILLADIWGPARQPDEVREAADEDPGAARAGQ